MGLEMSLARLCAPFFGSSLPVWAVIISGVLISIAIGYAVGGRISLREQHREFLGWALFIAAIAIAGLAVGGHAMLGAAAAVGKGVHPALRLIALLSIAVMAAVPLISLSAVLPLCVRASVENAEHAGNISARIHAVATVGSIAGTLAPAFLILPNLGLKIAFVGLASGCLLGAALLAPSWIRIFFGAALIATASLISPRLPERHAPGSRVILDTSTTAHARVIVRERANGLRELLVDEAWSVQSVYNPRGLTTTDAWPSFRVAPWLMRRGAPNRVLIIGFAGGTMARDLGLLFPSVSIDGVEIDGELVDIAREHMGIEPDINVFNEDGRRFLARAEQSYDIIIVDAYRDLYIPEHLATVEFFGLAARHLRPGGVVAINVLTYRNEKSLANAMANTMSRVFSTVDILGIDRSMNSAIFGYFHDRDQTRLSRGELSNHSLSTDRLATRRASKLRPFQPHPNEHVFTDDRVPVTTLTHRIAWKMLFGERNLTRAIH